MEILRKLGSNSIKMNREQYETMLRNNQKEIY